jgi:hypothetical protein
MGIVADTRGDRAVGARLASATGSRFFWARGRRPRAVRCDLRQFPGLERMAFPMEELDRQHGAGAGIVVRSAGAEHDHGRRQQDGHEVSQENG